MSINRGPFNALVDDDGTNTVGSIWNKAAIKDVILDPVDAALAASGGVTLPINLNTDVTGTLQAANTPAYTGGDVTSAAGSLNLTIGAGKITTPMLASTLSVPAKAITISPALLTDGATVTIDVTNRNAYYQLTAAGDRTLAAPSGTMADGQRLIIRHTAGGGAARTLALTTGAGGFRFGSDIPALTQTASGKTDYIGAIFCFADNRWDIVAYSKGY
jgi:hypothetical protein